MLEFGHRDIEAGPQFVFQAAQDLALVFEGMRAFDPKFESKDCDRHDAQMTYIKNQKPDADSSAGISGSIKNAAGSLHLTRNVNESHL